MLSRAYVKFILIILVISCNDNTRIINILKKKDIILLPNDLSINQAFQGENFVVYKDSLLFINDKDTLLEIDLIKNNKKIITFRTQAPEGHFFAPIFLLKNEKLHFIDHIKTSFVSYNINTDSLKIENTYKLEDFKDAFVNAVNQNFYYSKSFTDSISIIDSFGKVKRFKNLFSKEDRASEHDKIFIDQDKDKIIMISAQSGKFIITDTLFSQILYRSQLFYIYKDLKLDLLNNNQVYHFFNIKLKENKLFIGHLNLFRKVSFNNEFAQFNVQEYSTDDFKITDLENYPHIHSYFIIESNYIKVLNIGNNTLEYLEF